MTGPVDPARVLVLAVGIERYAHPKLPPLPGAADEALRFAHWAARSSVPPAQITVACNWVNAPANDTWKAGVQVIEPMEAVLAEYVVEVAERSGDVLLVFWCGHGLVSDDQQVLFTADANALHLRSLDVDQVLSYLRSKQITGFDRQVVLIDACANHLEDVNPDRSWRGLVSPANLPKARNREYLTQFALLSAAPGQTAEFRVTDRHATFSDVVLTWLERPDQQILPPDTLALDQHVREAFAALRAAGGTRQTPVQLIQRVNDERTNDYFGGAPAPATPSVGMVDDGPRMAAEAAADTPLVAGDDDGRGQLLRLLGLPAGKAYVSEAETWINTLVAAQITLYPDLQGPRGAVVLAQRIAVANYRERLAAPADTIDMTLLAVDIPPVQVTGLAEGLRARVYAHDGRPVDVKLLHLARRWRRLLLVGLPGMGKSTALRQLAARWAADGAAPVPVVVALSAVAQRCPNASAVTLSVLCELAASEAPGEQRDSLAHGLEQRCRDGNAILFADGLDECGARHGVVAQGLAEVIAGLPAETGVVVTTRASAFPAAGMLDFPEAKLVTPDGLDDVLDKVLQDVAARRVDPARLDRWLEARRSWLRRVRKDHRSFADVPLLATILVLVLADEGDILLPSGPARLLEKAVTGSVKKWERVRAVVATAFEVDLSPAELLDGFAVLGHLLADPVEPVSSETAQAAVAAILTTPQWGYARAPAREKAEAILWFWDHQVGVFVQTETGLTARNRVFTEIAVAMWTGLLDDAALADWIADALRDDQHHQVLRLAAELKPAVLALLVGEHADPAAATIAADAVQAGAGLGPAQWAQLVEALAAAAAASQASGTGGPSGQSTTQPANQVERDGPGWLPLLKLGTLRLPSQLRARRDALLAAGSLTDERRTLLAGLTALAGAAADHRQLSPADVEAVQHMLRLPRSGPVVTSRQVDGLTHFDQKSFLLTGHVDGALDAARRLPEIGLEFAVDIQEICEWADFQESLGLTRTLTDHGAELKPSRLAQSLAPLAAMVLPLREVDRERPLLDAIAQITETPADVSGPRRWRYDDLAHLLAAAGAHDVRGGDFIAAMTLDSDDTRRGWIIAMIGAADVSPAAVADQARQALIERVGEPKVGNLWSLLITPWPDPLPGIDPGLLTQENKAFLVTALKAESNWLAQTARDALWGLIDAELSTMLVNQLTDYPPARRYLVAQLACRCTPDPVTTATQLLATSDAAQRIAGAGRLRSLDRNLPSVAAAQDSAALDPDLTVRHAVSRDDRPIVDNPAASYWTCVPCAIEHDLAVTQCPGCRRRRPAAA